MAWTKYVIIMYTKIVSLPVYRIKKKRKFQKKASARQALIYFTLATGANFIPAVSVPDVASRSKTVL
ncbi:MAG: hypothetical protein LBR26_03980 [Prevotella sp.]|nr:hypothetical protein [Prevotella sp.]